MKKAKWIISSTLALSLFGSGVYAGTVLQTYKTVRGDFATVEKEEVHKNRIALKVDGVKANKPTWYANDTTYVPLRDAAELLGVNVNYNSATMTAELTKKNTTTPSTPTVPSDSIGKTRATAAKINQLVIVDRKSYSNTSEKFELTLTEVISGTNAWDMIYSENHYNSPPPAGKQYVLAKFKVKVIALQKEPMELNHIMFDAVSSTGTKYTDFNTIVSPKPDLRTTYYSDSVYEGYTYFLINENDKAKVVLNEGHSSARWFDLGL